MPQETTSYVRMERREEQERVIMFDRIAEIVFSALLIVAAVSPHCSEKHGGKCWESVRKQVACWMHPWKSPNYGLLHEP